MKKIITLIICVSSILTAAAFPSVAEGDYDDDFESYYDQQDTICPMYIDLPKDKWYSVPMVYAARRQLLHFSGVSGRDVDTQKYVYPKKAITREEAVYMIINASTSHNYDPDDLIDYIIFYEGEDFLPKEPVFSDVAEDSPYYPYIQYAYVLGITAGISNGKFGMGQEISRQDFALMSKVWFDHLASVFRCSIDVDDTVVQSFADYDSVSGYAKDVLTLYCGIKTIYSGFFYDDGLLTAKKIICGDNGYLRPRDSITRAEAATVLYIIYRNMYCYLR